MMTRAEATPVNPQSAASSARAASASTRSGVPGNGRESNCPSPAGTDGGEVRACCPAALATENSSIPVTIATSTRAPSQARARRPRSWSGSRDRHRGDGAPPPRCYDDHPAVKAIGPPVGGPIASRSTRGKGCDGCCVRGGACGPTDQPGMLMVSGDSYLSVGPRGLLRTLVLYRPSGRNLYKALNHRTV